MAIACTVKDYLNQHHIAYEVLPHSHMARETEMLDLFKDCAAGAVPALGAAYGIETIWDDSLQEQPDIYFEAGDHEQLVHLSGKQFLDLLGTARHGHFSSRG